MQISGVQQQEESRKKGYESDEFARPAFRA